MRQLTNVRRYAELIVNTLTLSLSGMITGTS